MGIWLRVLFTFCVLARPGRTCPLVPAVQSRRLPGEQAWACGARFLPSGDPARLLRQVDACALSSCLSSAQAQPRPGSSWHRNGSPPSAASSGAGAGAGQGGEQPRHGARCLPPPALRSGNGSECERQGTSVLSSFGCSFTQEHDRVARSPQVFGQDADGPDNTVPEAACLQERGCEAAPLHI